jgi:hypothetical protein
MYLLGRYPSFRVAYIDEVEAPSQDRNKKIDKVYYSVLVKASVTKSNDPGQSLDQVLQHALLIQYSFDEIFCTYVDCDTSPNFFVV